MFKSTIIDHKGTHRENNLFYQILDRIVTTYTHVNGEKVNVRTNMSTHSNYSMNILV